MLFLFSFRNRLRLLLLFTLRFLLCLPFDLLLLRLVIVNEDILLPVI